LGLTSTVGGVTTLVCTVGATSEGVKDCCCETEIWMPEVGLTEATEPEVAGTAGAAGTEGVMVLTTVVATVGPFDGLTVSESLLTMAALAPVGTAELELDFELDEDDENPKASLSVLAASAGPATHNPFLSTKPGLQAHPLRALLTAKLY
jgi:hypothetical protein